MPAEWQEHERTFISWPVKEAMIWPENYDEICRSYAQIINSIISLENVTVLANKSDLKLARELCDCRVQILEIPHNDAWLRDNGPTFIWDEGKLKGIDWKFNAWGEKYKPYQLDDQVAEKLLSIININRIDAPIVLEGGSFHVDGQGTMLTTEECLLNKNRNPFLSKNEIETYLMRYLNVSKIIWIKNGLSGDETDGHVDNIACFAKPGVVFLQTCYDKEDTNYEITQQALSVLKSSTDAKGRSFEVIELPQPPKLFYRGKRLTLSYINFYFINKGIILPIFGGDAKETDEEVTKILQETYPERSIIPVDGMGLISEGGNVHCITQQMPGEIIKN